MDIYFLRQQLHATALHDDAVALMKDGPSFISAGVHSWHVANNWQRTQVHRHDDLTLSHRNPKGYLLYQFGCD
jgi:hypothetical protein